jgi:hypothetical protein
MYQRSSASYGVVEGGPEQVERQPANNPLHRIGESMGRAVALPSAMWSRLACSGAYVRQPVSRERWPAEYQSGRTKQAEPSSDRVGKHQNALVYQKLDFCRKGAVMVCLSRERKVDDAAND